MDIAAMAVSLLSARTQMQAQYAVLRKSLDMQGDVLKILDPSPGPAPAGQGQIVDKTA
jgi:hypothetical protein